MVASQEFCDETGVFCFQMQSLSLLYLAGMLIYTFQFIHFIADITPRSTDSTTSGSSESSMNQVRFQDPLCTIHSYIIEDSESDSDVNEPRDMEDDSMSETGSADDLYFDSKFSTWC